MIESRKPTPAQRDLLAHALGRADRKINTYRTPEITTRIMREQEWVKLEPVITDAAEIKKRQDELVALVMSARGSLNASLDNWKAALACLSRVQDISHELSAHCYRITEKGAKAIGQEWPR